MRWPNKRRTRSDNDEGLEEESSADVQEVADEEAEGSENEMTVEVKVEVENGVEEDLGGEQEEEEEEEEKITTGEVHEVKQKKKKKRRKKKTRTEKKAAEDERRRQKQKNVQVDDDDEGNDGVEVEYVSENIDIPKWDPNYAAFSKIFEAFKIEQKLDKKKEEEPKQPVQPVKQKPIIDPILNDDDSDDDEEGGTEEDVPKLSKKKLKRASRMEIAQLKQLVSRPDVVEMHDVNSRDPKLLVYLKAYKNTVPVPRHWCFKRKYLAGKRGFIKPPFELPDFIKQTGIMEMRAAMQEKEESKAASAKARSKIRPKLGKIDIDYQKLHDAFFKYQTKPKMTIHGDLYYEGKEFEIKLKEKKPGDLSDDLHTALGMPIGPGKELIPPPWLIAMQRYGPPPSYPNLKIPGLNAAIPDGASFGYHAGGWGKPPVDEMGKPLYGDVFGTQTDEIPATVEEEIVDKTPWGELESESESEDESEDEEEEEDATGMVTPGDAGLITPSGLSSVGAGLETPDMIELRKKKEIEDAMETGGETPALFTILNEKRAAVGAAMMGSAHTYDIGLTTPKKAGEGVEITLDPSELELEPAAMAAKYDDTIKEREAALNREDLSDMVAEHAAKKKRKKPTESGKGAKKYKEFKF